MHDLIPEIHQVANADLEAKLVAHINQQTKPLGSLGRLEQLMVQLGLIQQTLTPSLEQAQVMVFAGDHGLAAEGVSLYPSDVTWQMVQNFLAGGAAISVLARQHQLKMTVVDAGVNHAFEPQQGLAIAKIGFGTANARHKQAMTPEQTSAAIAAGKSLLAIRPGNAVLLGEMGIGNTSSAALLFAWITKTPINDCVGRGTGLDDAQVEHKISVLRATLEHHAKVNSAFEALCAFGGFEIAMMVGTALQAAHERRVIIIDGFIASSAILIAHALSSNVLDYCVFSHQSQEKGHQLMLAYLAAKPLLNLDLRLGEGSGAALAWPLIVSAVELLNKMATFTQAQVDGPVT